MYVPRRSERGGRSGDGPDEQVSGRPRMVTRIRMGKILDGLDREDPISKGRSCSFAHQGSAGSGADASRASFSESGNVGGRIESVCGQAWIAPKPRPEPEEELSVAWV